MAIKVGEVTIKVNYEMTEVSKLLIRGLVEEVLQEALLDDSARVPFDSKDAVRAFIREEVRLALMTVELPGDIHKFRTGQA